MIREVCSCGAEFETDDREAIELVKLWRRNHKHEIRLEQRDAVYGTHTELLGFQPREEEDD